MNKLLLDNREEAEDIIIDSDTYLYLSYIGGSRSLNIYIRPNVCLEVFDISSDTSNNITYNMAEGSKIIAKKVSTNCSDTINVNLDGKLANIKFSTALINYLDNSYCQNINHNYSNTKSRITNHAINILENELKINVNGVVKKNSKDCSFNQDNKIINLRDGKSFILPNLIVNNNLVDASHAAYIGSFDKDSIFYLKSRGIDAKDVNKLLIRAFMIDKMNLTESELDDVIIAIEDIK